MGNGSWSVERAVILRTTGGGVGVAINSVKISDATMRTPAAR